MPVRPDEPLTKVTLNLYTKDVEEMGVRYGHGWSTMVRSLVHAHLTNVSRVKTRPLTVGDLADADRS